MNDHKTLVIRAATRDNAFAVGLPNDVGVLEAGRLADIIILERDPLADIRVLQGGRHLARVIKDGAIVDRRDRPVAFTGDLTPARPSPAPA